jgi:hypothetical protein
MEGKLPLKLKALKEYRPYLLKGTKLFCIVKS